MGYQFDGFDRIDRKPGCVIGVANRLFPFLAVLVLLVIAHFIAKAGAPWLTQFLTEMGIF